MTPKSHECWAYIANYYEQHGYTPTLREIADALGLRSLASAFKRVERLQEDGVLVRERCGKGGRNSRNIRLLLVPAPEGLRLDQALVLAAGKGVRLGLDGEVRFDLFTRDEACALGWEVAA